MEKRIIKNMEDFRESITRTASDMGKGYALFMLTDKLDIQRLEQLDADWDMVFQKALEIRMFNENQEAKWFRSSIDKPLKVRIRSDEGEDAPKSSLDFWDEYQYLDIDEQKSDFLNGWAVVTGGGKYPLPLNGCSDVDDSAKMFADYRDVMIKVRNYLEYEKDTMRVFVSDWRLVGFVNGEGR